MDLLVPEGPFPNPFGLSVFGGLALAVWCFPILGCPPPPPLRFVFSFTSYLLESSNFVYFCMWKWACVVKSSPQIAFTCQVGASGHICFISLVRLQRGMYTLALGDVQRRVGSLVKLELNIIYQVVLLE